MNRPMSLRHVIKVLLPALLVLAICSEVYAEFYWQPQLTLREEYNDNIYLEEDDPEDDFITSVEPGISLGWKTEGVDLTLDYSLVFRDYLKNNGEDETSLSQTQRADLQSTFDLYGGVLFLYLSDVYERVPIDEGGKGGTNVELVNMTDSNRLLVNPYLQVPIGDTLTGKLGYSYENLWYDEGGDNADIHTIDASLSKELTSTLVLTLSGAQTYYRPDDELDEYDSQNVNAALTWQATSRLTLRGNIGREWLDYKVSRNAENDYADLYGYGADYQISDVFLVGFNVQQSIDIANDAEYLPDDRFAASQGASEETNYSAYLAYSGRLPWRVVVYRSESDYLTQNREDLSRGVYFGGSVPLNVGTGLGYFFNYTKFSEDPGNSEYERYEFALDWGYELSFGELSFGYTLNYNDSNQVDEDYTNNIAWVELGFNF